MKSKVRKTGKKNERGVALLISIFVLMLISVVAVALIVTAGSETSLASNYRGSTSAYYAGLAGLEEVRGRLVPRNPNYFDITAANFVPVPQTAMAVDQVRYVLNPAPGEVVAPTNLGSATTYPDNQYFAEFGVPVTARNVLTVNSATPTNGGATPGPKFKWVRLSAATESSLGIDVNNDGALNNTLPLFYDSAALPRPSLVLPNAGSPTTAPTSTAYPVYEITALAVISDGSEKLVQSVVTAVSYGLNFPAALTLAGSQVNFGGANSNQYYMDGQDGSGNPGNVAGCAPNPNNWLTSIGVTGPNNVNNVLPNSNPVPYTGIPVNRLDHYPGGPLVNGSPTVTSVASVTLPSTLQTPTSLNNVVQLITANADVVISGNATQADMPAGMSATNPMTVVVDGNLALTNNFTGYGLLVVTGNFAYSGTTGWKGIVLVIGDGTTTFLGNGGGNNEFDGAIYVATIKDAAGNLLPALGTVNYDISGGGGNGIYYNSCWVQSAQRPPSYKVLSFKEIPYND